MRGEENLAIADTIKILNDDGLAVRRRHISLFWEIFVFTLSLNVLPENGEA